MRRGAPEVGEPIFGPFKRGLICSLHVGAARAVTTWDPETDTCWLLAYDGYHRNGEPEDAYAVFIARFNAGDLLPTEDDWDSGLKDVDVAFLDKVREAGARLLELARAHPGKEEVETWTDGGQQVICVDLLIEGDGQAEQGWMGLTLPENETLSDADVFDLVARLVPEGADPLFSQTFKDRQRRKGEIVYTWEHYQSGPD